MRLGQRRRSSAVGTSVVSALQVDVAGEISALSAITPAGADLVLLEDASASNAKGKATLTAIFSALNTGSVTKWAVLTMSADQATVDESGPDLITGLDTVYAGSTSHGITVTAGVITLPANTTGYKWRLKASVAFTMSSTGSFEWSWTENPAGSPPVAAGKLGNQWPPTNTANNISAGSAGTALHFITGAASPGVICTFATGAQTATVLKDYSKFEIDEVPA